jgi:hypothetical protein
LNFVHVHEFRAYLITLWKGLDKTHQYCLIPWKHHDCITAEGLMHDTRDVHVFLPLFQAAVKSLTRSQRHHFYVASGIHVEQYLKDHRSQVYANCQTPSEILGRCRFVKLTKDNQAAANKETPQDSGLSDGSLNCTVDIFSAARSSKQHAAASVPALQNPQRHAVQHTGLTETKR